MVSQVRLLFETNMSSVSRKKELSHQNYTPVSRPTPKAPKNHVATPVQTGYLIFYNAFSAMAWSVVLGRTLSTFMFHGYDRALFTTSEWTKWTQTIAVMEILHSLLGIVRAPIVTTIMQVASRFLLVWGIIWPIPHLAFLPFCTTMLVAWSITEVIRYSYFALSLSGLQPKPLVWLRYNTFFVLYPLGIFSECALVYFATFSAPELGDLYRYALYVILVLYIPGTYTLYTHMMKQRKKVMRSMEVKCGKAAQAQYNLLS